MNIFAMSPFTETDLMLNKDGSVYHLNLLPKHLSDIIITVGDPSRVFHISNFFDKIEVETNHREFFTHIGKYKGKRITVISTGMGTPNIEILLTELNILANYDLKNNKPRSRRKKLKIIRIGTSAAIQEDIPLGTHLLSNYAVGIDNLLEFYNLSQTDFEKRICQKIQHDAGLSFTPYMSRGSTELAASLDLNVIEGNTVTTPGFYAPQNRMVNPGVKYPNLLNDLSCFHEKDFWLTNFEMETAAYYALGRILNHDIISVNAIIANRLRKKVSKNPVKVTNGMISKILEGITGAF